MREDLCEEVSPNTKTIVFESVSGEPVPNFRGFYDSFDYLAKHFLVRDLEGGPRGVARHYTICNAMRPAVYKAYIAALKDDSTEGHAYFPPSLLDMKDTNQLTVCIKNYQHERGLSTKIHEQPQHNRQFEVKGPMGHGLRPYS